MSRKTFAGHLPALFAAMLITPILLVLFHMFAGTSTGAAGSAPSLFRSLPPQLLWVDFAALLLMVFLTTLVIIYVYRVILRPLDRLYRDLTAAERLNPSAPNGDGTGKGVIEDIACTIDQLADNLDKNQKKLETRTSELNDTNWELKEANFELEASYGQLQATIEQLNEAEQKYHSLVRNIPEIVCVVDRTGIISFVNHVSMDILGYEKTELIGTNVLDLIDAKVSMKSLQYIAERLKSKNTVTIELPLVRKDQEVILTEVTFSNYVYNGEIMGLQTIVRDITQKRKLEEELVHSHKNLHILNTISKSITAILDPEELSNVIVREITEALGVAACTLSLLDEGGTRLQVKAFSGSHYNEVESIEEFSNIDLLETEIGRAVVEHKVVSLQEIPDNMVMARVNKSKPEKERVKELLVVPLVIKDKRIGSLVVGSVSRVGQNDVDLLTSIANSAAVAFDNALLYDTSKKYFFRTIDALIAAVEAKDKYTEGHSQRVSRYAEMIARHLGLPREQIEEIKIAGILHDVGKIGISDTILSKPGKLTEEEYAEIKLHPGISNRILYPVGFSDRTLKAIAFHHERYDGRGYPNGLAGDNISFEAQIIAVADAYDAMTTNRSYRSAMNRHAAVRELQLNKATQFNPLIVDTFIDIIGRWEGND